MQIVTAEILGAAVEARMQASTLTADSLPSKIRVWAELATDALMAKDYDDALFYTIALGMAERRAVELFGSEKAERLLASEIVG